MGYWRKQINLGVTLDTNQTLIESARYFYRFEEAAGVVSSMVSTGLANLRDIPELKSIPSRRRSIMNFIRGYDLLPTPVHILVTGGLTYAVIWYGIPLIVQVEPSTKLGVLFVGFAVNATYYAGSLKEWIRNKMKE